MVYRISREDRYYKDQDPDRPLMSGLPLPKDADGVVRNCDFARCSFHPNCRQVRFEHCTFERCDGVEYLGKLEDCEVKD